MESWKTSVVCEGFGHRPRQFEYHPTINNLLVFGTLRGEAIVCRPYSNFVVQTFNSGLSTNRFDAILGLCWLRLPGNRNRFVSGSSTGVLTVCDAAEGIASLDSEENTSLPKVVDTARAQHSITSFNNLTSVHVNSDDTTLMASGYSHNVAMYDIESGGMVREYKNIHEDHINITRFAHHSPTIFATSSFDKTVKLWDTRQSQPSGPIYTLTSDQGNVMLCFSPDDMHLLTSAVDNEIRQYIAVDGRLHLDFNTPTGLSDNFTRAYYSSSGRYILSGSSEETAIRLYCSSTGTLLRSSRMYSEQRTQGLYVQSLRGDPHSDTRLCVLVNYRDHAYPLEMVSVDMSEKECDDGNLPIRSAVQAEQGCDGGGADPPNDLFLSYPSKKFIHRLATALQTGAGSDIIVTPRQTEDDPVQFPAHRLILMARSPTLRGLLREGSTGDGDDTPVHALEWVPDADMLRVLLEFLYTDGLTLPCERAAAGGVAWPLAVPRKRVQPGTPLRFPSTRDASRALAECDSTLRLAADLELPHLRGLVLRRLEGMVHVHTVLRVAQVAVRHRCPGLLELCRHHTVAHADFTSLQPSLAGAESTPASIEELVASVDRDGHRRSLPINPEGGQDEAELAVLQSADNYTEAGLEEAPDETGLIPSLFIPQCFAHSASLVHGNRMLVIGGGNKLTFTNLQSFPVLTPAPAPDVRRLDALSADIHTDDVCGMEDEGLPGMPWFTKVRAQDQRLPPLLFHTATPLEPAQYYHSASSAPGRRERLQVAGPRHLVVYGRGQYSRPSNHVAILDTFSLRWHLVEPFDCEPIPDVRVKHTLTLVPPQTPPPELASADSMDGWARAGVGESRMVLFGGMGRVEPSNEVCLLTVRQNPDWCDGNSSEEEAPRFTCWWQWPKTTGDAPTPRLGHTATMIPSKSLLVIIGGIGPEQVHSDVLMLNCSNLSHLMWERVEVSGHIPPCTGHTADLVVRPTSEHCRTGSGERVMVDATETFDIVKVGSFMPSSVNDMEISVLTLDLSSGIYRGRWSSLTVAMDHPRCSLPAPHHGWFTERPTFVNSHTCCYDVPNEQLIVFGGREGASRNMTSSTSYIKLEFGEVSDERTISRAGFFRAKQQMVEPGRFPSAEVHSSTFVKDLGSLVNSEWYSDMSIQSLDPEDGSLTSIIKAHSFMVNLFDNAFSAMLRSGMQEAASNQLSLQISSAHSTAFLSLMAYIYTNTFLVFDSGDFVDPIVHPPSAQLVMEIIYLANQYSIDELVALCEGLLVRIVDASSNAAALYDFADTFQLEYLKDAVRAEVCRHPTEFIESEEYSILRPDLIQDLEDFRLHKHHMYVCESGRGLDEEEYENANEDAGAEDDAASSSSSSSSDASSQSSDSGNDDDDNDASAPGGGGCAQS